ncbi:MAG: hypothetical protein R3362_09395, partial [Rhodothermales bacterium]|nr:hypothetical protein [Rhodothermales bacterium]
YEGVPFQPRLSVEVFGGVSTYGRFLEQRIDMGDAFRDRELRARPGLSLGLAGTYRLAAKTGVRLGFTYTTSELEYFDDTGDDRDVLDSGAGANIASVVGAAEVVQYFLEGEGTVVPYAVAGVSGVLWTLDPEGDIVAAGGEDSALRIGGVTGVGLEVRPNEQFLVRVEINAATLGNPFDGPTSFGVEDAGETVFDEPDIVTALRASLGVGYTF